jgi:hypothetical protein
MNSKFANAVEALLAANAVRRSGLAKVDDLVTEAMLKPELARTLFATVSPKTALAVGKMLAAQIRALSVSGTVRHFEGARGG